MTNPIDIDLVTEVKLALTETYPDSTFGAIPITEQYEALMSYRAADDDVLAEIPGALAAHLNYQRKQWG